MAKTNTQETDSRPVTVKMSKLIEGIGVVFAGVMTMLEALDASTAKTLVDGLAHDGGETAGAAERNADIASNNIAADAVEKKEPAPEVSQPAKTAQPASSLTVDDVARIVVQKVKANPGINEKIRALVIAHGAQRVTELKPENLEAFLTDLSQL